MEYRVRLGDGTEETVQAAAYRQEGPIVTFYRTDDGRRSIDCWATPVASFRTTQVDRIVLAEPGAA
jgi:hypothetical protein